jgi:predicted dinucleotide-binding enzyme
MRLRKAVGAMFASKPSHNLKKSAEICTYHLPEMMRTSSNHMGSGKLSTREETRLVVHMFVSTTNSTRKTVKMQTFQSIIGLFLVISGGLWKRRKRLKND